MRDHFSQAEWERLRLLPFMMFEVVADVDTEVDTAEMKELLHGIDHPAHDHERLHRELFGDLTGTPGLVESLLTTAVERAKTANLIEAELEDEREILQARLPDAEYRQFIASMIRFVTKIAAASGPWNHRIEPLEQAAVDVLADFFGLPELDVLLHHGTDET